MFGINGIWLYLLVFCGKMIEVSFSTLRIILVGKGKKVLGMATGFFEVTIWVLLASSVLDDVTSDPWKLIAYCTAFCCGLLLGSFLEEKLAVGLTSIQIVVPVDECEKLASTLRDNGFGVTIMDGRSVDGTPRCLVFIQLRRRLVPEAVAVVRRISPDAVVSVSDIRSVSGGYIR